MHPIFIYYNNGYYEAVDKLNIALLHMVEVGVIKIIVDTKSGKAWTRSEDGISKEHTVPQVSGLH